MTPKATDTTTSAAKPLEWTWGRDYLSQEDIGLRSREPIVVNECPRVLRRIVARNQLSTAERLFNATTEAKMWTSRVAMRLDSEARKRIFRQLDRLHDIEEWFDGDTPIDLDSYKSFIRAVLLLSMASKPSLALTPAGNVLAMWGDNQDRLSMEFLPGDRARWVLSLPSDDGVERSAGETTLLRISDVLAPFDPEHWFDAA